MSLLVPATARGDIYKWTDEQGRVNISNVPPPASGQAKDIEVVLKESRAAPIAQHVATPTERALLARIEALERQLQSRQTAAQLPPQTTGPAYYPSAPPPPPPSQGYYASAYASSYPRYYPSYSYPVASSYVVYPARTYVSRPAFVSRPVFVAPRGSFAHSGGGHGGHRGRR